LPTAVGGLSVRKRWGHLNKDRIISSAKDVGGKLEGAVGDATGDAKVQSSGFARETSGAAQDLHGQAKDVARSVGDAAKDAYEKSKTLRAGSESVAQEVQQNPLGSLLIEGCIGFALALLMTTPAASPTATAARVR
jgi:uncharacterized protein YjbJ (UPF0337 family)